MRAFSLFVLNLLMPSVGFMISFYFAYRVSEDIEYFFDIGGIFFFYISVLAIRLAAGSWINKEKVRAVPAYLCSAAGLVSAAAVQWMLLRSGLLDSVHGDRTPVQFFLHEFGMGFVFKYGMLWFEILGGIVYTVMAAKYSLTEARK